VFTVSLNSRRSELRAGGDPGDVVVLHEPGDRCRRR
jgi:hypothetical protein